ncbi:hypothetical protein B2J68_19575 [Vibrio cholerae]|uniref:hypothetical protein n=1 Tax=Vibrio cholerae TaxID=666 RepID=UPI000B4C7E29|nr:hypothetical protein [Vibrio cholerae]OWO67365.1 hypothetical protein B2J68_19575 [Vibrio cholerae]
MSVQICEFGTAPKQVKDGYRSLGIVIQGSDDAVSHIFERTGDVRLVRGSSIFGTNEYEFYVMIKD